jgi:hypothetical protein
MEGFLGVDNRIHDLAQEQGISNALVLVEACPGYTGFGCYGSVFWRNTPDLDGDIVYARDIVALRAEIIAAFPGRDVYVAKYTQPSLQLLQRADP